MPRSDPTTGVLDAEKIERLLASAQSRPDLPDIPWRDDQASFDWSGLLRPQGPAPEPPPAGVSPIESDPHTYGAVRRRIRDRYIGVRFAGVAACGDDLENTTRVIKAARLAFEEEQADAALELLELAIEQNASDPRLWLAELEIAFLARDPAHFAGAARAFHYAFPTHREWSEVARLGRALAPEEPLFGPRQGPRSHEHYGPWPHTPNWIEAPWDLTPEVDAAEFHRAMTRDERDAK